MAGDKLSAKEAALIAQARAELGKTAGSRPQQSSRCGSARDRRTGAVAARRRNTGARERRSGAAHRRAHGSRARRKRAPAPAPAQALCVGTAAFTSLVGLWALLWLWHRL